MFIKQVEAPILLALLLSTLYLLYQVTEIMAARRKINKLAGKNVFITGRCLSTLSESTLSPQHVCGITSVPLTHTIHFLSTGASGGLGEALVDECIRNGARSIIISGRNTLELQRVVDKYQDSTCKMFMVVMDLTLPLPSNLMEQIHKEMGDATYYINVLINNAGAGFRGSFVESTLEVQRQVMEADYWGAVKLTQLFLPAMLTNRDGTIINIASVQGKLGIAQRTAYSAAKHALVGFFDSLRAEVGGVVHILNVLPGYIKTGHSRNAITAEGRQYGKQDESTEGGYSPSSVAGRIVTALARSEEEVVIADVKTRLALFLRYFAPSVLFKKTRK